MRIRFLLIAAFFQVTAASAQMADRFQSIEYQRALEQGTRSPDGSPGPLYWQNTASYSIDAEFFPEEDKIRGKAEIDYRNNSPDTLRQLVFDLYQDLYRKGNTRDWDIGMADLHEGTLISKMKINGAEIDVHAGGDIRRQHTKLIVKTLLPPGTQHAIEVEWEVPIPATRTVRMGRYSDSVAFVAYWFPHIAVYDDIDGWDMIPYRGSVEFYNDFKDFDIRLTLPGDFVVWATGLLQNPESVFMDEIVARYQNALSSDEVVRVIEQADYTRGVVTRNAETLTWHFKAESVPDFSFAAAKGFNWDAVSIEVEPGRRVLTDAVYPDGAIHYEKVAAYARQSIQFMSETVPGVPFPYPQMTNFCNGRPSGGMETPMMANNSAPANEANIFGLTFHEIAHSYFPFAMGTNEKKYAWMDEGFASLWPHVMVDSLFPDYRYLERAFGGFQDRAHVETAVPPMVPNHMIGADYPALRLASYVRPAVALHLLENALGSEMYLLALRTFMKEWEGKHPLPHDFFNTFERISGKRLNWYFEPWFYGFAYPDLAIQKVTDDRKLVIENKGGLPLPVELTFTFTDGSVAALSFSTSIWQSGEKHILVDIPGRLPVQQISLGSAGIPDSNTRNNVLYIID